MGLRDGRGDRRGVHGQHEVLVGDHCVDPRLVPGVFFCNRTIASETPSLVDIAPTVMRILGKEPPLLHAGPGALRRTGRAGAGPRNARSGCAQSVRRSPGSTGLLDDARAGRRLERRSETRRRHLPLAIPLCGALGRAAASTMRAESSPPGIFVLGIDGVDPVILERLIDEGRMPHFARLAEEGTFQPLGTSTPPQSPVAWSNFVTGRNPGGHGIFDFIHRDPKTYQPLSSATRPPSGSLPRALELFGYTIPLGGDALRNNRGGIAFWDVLQRGRRRRRGLPGSRQLPADALTRQDARRHGHRRPARRVRHLQLVSSQPRPRRSTSRPTTSW